MTTSVGKAPAVAPTSSSESDSFPEDGRRRVVVSSVGPRIANGRFAVKRTEGDVLRVRADLVADGHDVVAGVVRARVVGASDWVERKLASLGNDRFEAELTLDRVGRWELEVEGWIDAFASWHHELERREELGEVLDIDLAIGARLLADAATRAEASDRARLDAAAKALLDRAEPIELRTTLALALDLLALASAHADRSHATRSEPWPVVVDPVHARFAAWYELFPRATGEEGAHGTFRTAETWLPYVLEMGFDVLYLPPIHPIGLAFRKGPENTLGAGPEQPGSPWAIGAPEGGHTAVHPALGTLDDFDRLLKSARDLGLKVALDIAFQASPDHPWVRQHPEWFKHRPDGTIQYAENPPKKYQDVYPFDFETESWRELWAALRDVFRFWIARGVTIFRVDNPHTKPVPFWQWCIESIKADHPEVTFLAEAFTRPRLKYALANVGFSQGYTYFTWRSTKAGLMEYLTELTRPDIADTFRPSFWPNTPDILPDDLQYGGRPAFLARLILAGTLSSHYGIYGPVYELEEHLARPGSGEYAKSEKYEIRQWDRNRPSPTRRAITSLNAIRRAHPALQRNETLRFHPTDNEFILCYSKIWGEDVVVVAVSLDFQHRQSGWVTLDLASLGIDPEETFQVHDLLGGGRHAWRGSRSYVDIDPQALPAQIFAVRRKVRSERDFDYYL